MGVSVEVQRARLGPLATLPAASLKVPEVVVCHVALLPEQLVQSLDVDVPVITWQRLLAAYADVAPAYWVALQSAALTIRWWRASRMPPVPSNGPPATAEW